MTMKMYYCKEPTDEAIKEKYLKAFEKWKDAFISSAPLITAEGDPMPIKPEREFDPFFSLRIDPEDAKITCVVCGSVPCTHLDRLNERAVGAYLLDNYIEESLDELPEFIAPILGIGCELTYRFVSTYDYWRVEVKDNGFVGDFITLGVFQRGLDGFPQIQIMTQDYIDQLKDLGAQCHNRDHYKRSRDAKLVDYDDGYCFISAGECKACFTRPKTNWEDLVPEKDDSALRGWHAPPTTFPHLSGPAGTSFIITTTK